MVRGAAGRSFAVQSASANSRPSKAALQERPVNAVSASASISATGSKLFPA
jgi:hypothetical protein